MNNLNTVLMEGTLTRDPQREERSAEFSMCKLTLANNRYYRDNRKKEKEQEKDRWTKESSYFYVYVSGPVAESCLKYLTKGRGVRIVGRLKQKSWRDYDGTWRERVYIIAEHIEFQPPKKTDDIPDVGPEKRNGPPDTKADTAAIEALEEARRQAQEPEPEKISDEPVIPTILDDGAKEIEPTAEDDSFSDEPEPF
ncbi:MAG: single-stranded DNA-binding protein [Spirochaetales bacterium]|nr:single-stranded DNA-binding protein [Spirochaetales bacterium]